VSASLPAALDGVGIDVRVLLPGYPEVMRGGGAAEALASGRLLGVDWRLLQARLPSGVPLYILDSPALFARSGGPYQAASGEDWADNGLRFGLFSRIAALLGGEASPIAWRPAVIHANDWPAGLAPAYLRSEPGARAASVMTIHNLAFQGNFGPELITRLEFAPHFYSIDGLEFYGRLSFLKGGLVFADAITTVSPSYAREIQTDEFGCGMDGLLRHRSAALSGILNGIDTAIWDPAADSHIAQRYALGSLHLKQKNKAALRRRMNLQEDPKLPLIGLVSRFTHQKGIDLVAAAADELAGLPVQLAVLGSGERAYEEALLAAAARHPGRIAVTVGFNEELAHSIEAGADLFLMPSRFEPCGLNQMYSQRYGTPPVARATGGLGDTIRDGETGFLFERAETAALLAALRRALGVYADARRWREVQASGMRRDFSWETAARQYADLYLRLASRVPA
jgi:starch synthase